MKKKIIVTSLMIMLAAAPAMGQMMGGGRSQMMDESQGGRSTQQMMQQQQMQQTGPTGDQYNPQYMNPGTMGTYGYGMGPQMMGNYGYGMGPGMMGTEQPPCITGGYNYGMPMMGNNPMMHGMMGYYSPEQYEKQFQEHQKFLDDTHDLRKKLHTLKFDFAEAQRDPDTKREDLEKLNTEMESTWKQIYEKKKSVIK